VKSYRPDRFVIVRKCSLFSYWYAHRIGSYYAVIDARRLKDRYRWAVVVLVKWRKTLAINWIENKKKRYNLRDSRVKKEAMTPNVQQSTQRFAAI